MKKLALILLLVAGLASPALAGQVQVGYAASGYGMYQTGSGGEFTLTPLTGWISNAAYGLSAKNVGLTGSFQTFCIEAGEYIYPYSSTYYANLNTNAMFGGVAGNGGDAVSAGTGWLYSQFARGTLAGYNFGGSEAAREVSAGLLQNTIWWLEGESNSGGATNIFGQAVLAKFNNVAADAQGGSAADYGVYALNLWTSDTVHDRTTAVQDQLFYVPDGGTTLMLLGGALMGLGALRRKFGV